MGLSHSLPFPVLWGLTCFQRKPRRKGGTGESSSDSHGVCSGSCCLVVVAVTELLSAQSVFQTREEAGHLGSCPSFGDSIKETSLPEDLQNM